MLPNIFQWFHIVLILYAYWGYFYVYFNYVPLFLGLELRLQRSFLRYQTSCIERVTYYIIMSSNENVFCVTVPLWKESTRHRWIPFTKGRWYGPLMFLCCLSELNVEQTVDWPVIRDDMTDIAVMYEFVCICASITKWISVISKLFPTNVSKILHINPQKGKLQDEMHTSLSCEKSSKYEGGRNAGTLHSVCQCPVL